jgi:hypothetical protein
MLRPHADTDQTASEDESGDDDEAGAERPLKRRATASAAAASPAPAAAPPATSEGDGTPDAALEALATAARLPAATAAQSSPSRSTVARTWTRDQTALLAWITNMHFVEAGTASLPDESYVRQFVIPDRWKHVSLRLFDHAQIVQKIRNCRNDSARKKIEVEDAVVVRTQAAALDPHDVKGWAALGNSPQLSRPYLAMLCFMLLHDDKSPKWHGGGSSSSSSSSGSKKDSRASARGKAGASSSADGSAAAKATKLATGKASGSRSAPHKPPPSLFFQRLPAEHRPEESASPPAFTGIKRKQVDVLSAVERGKCNEAILPPPHTVASHQARSTSSAAAAAAAAGANSVHVHQAPRGEMLTTWPHDRSYIVTAGLDPSAGFEATVRPEFAQAYLMNDTLRLVNMRDADRPFAEMQTFAENTLRHALVWDVSLPPPLRGFARKWVATFEKCLAFYFSLHSTSAHAEFRGLVEAFEDLIRKQAGPDPSAQSAATAAAPAAGAAKDGSAGSAVRVDPPGVVSVEP